MNNTFYGPNDFRNYLEHHGVLGMKWGVRRYQNSDGTLNAKGKKKEAKLNPKIAKKINKKVWNPKGDFTNRNKVFAKMEKELDNSKEGKDYNNLIKNNHIIIRDKKGNIVKSYTSVNGSTLAESLNIMEKENHIKNNYVIKTKEIGLKYISDQRGATLKDLGYEDSEAGRDYLKKLGILGTM